MLVQIFENDIVKVTELLGGCDAFILLQNGVYCSRELVKLTNKPIFGIQEDFEAAGLIPPSGVELISNELWVDLCAKHSPIVSIQ